MIATRRTAIANEGTDDQHSRSRRRPGSHHRGLRGAYKKLSQELRDLAIKYCERMDDKSTTQAARELGVKRSTLSTHQFLQDALDKDCTQTLGTLKEKIENNFSDLAEKNILISGLWRLLIQGIGYSLIRVKPVEERRNTTATIEARHEYVNKLLTKGIAYNNNYIFVDEAGFNANLARGVEYSKKGSQSVVVTQTKRAVNVSILAAISYHGVEDISVKKVQGGTTGAIFKEFIQGIMKKLDDGGCTQA